VNVAAADKYPTLQTLKTEPGARTIALDSRNGRVYIPYAKFGPAPAPSAQDPKPRPVMDAESFTVLVAGE
jgi:hypothetical protein